MSIYDRRAIVELHNHSAREGALITVARVGLSASHALAARLLTLADGRSAGASSLQQIEIEASVEAAMHQRSEVDFLREPLGTPESDALLAVLAADEEYLVVTRFPEGGHTLARMVVNSIGNVTFASEHLETETIVDLRNAVRRAYESVVTVRSFLLERISPTR